MSFFSNDLILSTVFHDWNINFTLLYFIIYYYLPISSFIHYFAIQTLVKTCMEGISLLITIYHYCFVYLPKLYSILFVCIVKFLSKLGHLFMNEYWTIWVIMFFMCVCVRMSIAFESAVKKITCAYLNVYFVQKAQLIFASLQKVSKPETKFWINHSLQTNNT